MKVRIEVSKTYKMMLTAQDLKTIQRFVVDACNSYKPNSVSSVGVSEEEYKLFNAIRLGIASLGDI